MVYYRARASLIDDGATTGSCGCGTTGRGAAGCAGDGPQTGPEPAGDTAGPPDGLMDRVAEPEFASIRRSPFKPAVHGSRT